MIVAINIERFHNELAIRLGYERIVKDKRISISVEESDVPVVTLKVQGCADIRYKASDDTQNIATNNRNEIKVIVDAAHQAYLMTNETLF